MPRNVGVNLVTSLVGSSEDDVSSVEVLVWRHADFYALPARSVGL